MRIEPGGAELLRVARETLLQDLLAALPADRHYTLRMVANAMAIAARELQGLGGDALAERARLMRLMPQWQPPHDAKRAVREGNALLAASIRGGRYDAPESGRALASHLEATTAERLSVSSPKRR